MLQAGQGRLELQGLVERLLDEPFDGRLAPGAQRPPAEAAGDPLRAGARGYIMKRETTKKVITAIRQVLEGRLYVSERLASLFAEKFVEGRAAAVPASMVLLLSSISGFQGYLSYR